MALAQTSDVQQAALSFFGPVTVAWLAICAAWLVLLRRWPALRPAPFPPSLPRPWQDVGLALGAAALVFALGEAYRRKWLLPAADGLAGLVLFVSNQLVIFSPLFVVMLARGQGLATALTPRTALGPRLLTGLLLGLGGGLIVLAMRGEIARGPALMLEAVAGRSLAHFVPVFLEGFGVAFLFVRLRWAVGPVTALLLPCLLFAAAHVPRGIEAGQSTATLLTFFAFNTLLPLVIVGVVVRARDVVTLGVAHYLMDVVIGAFR
jgi:hypothetical protein